MKISQISKIKNCRTFVNFAWPAELSPFQDYNLIYGWNGTGKTTIADVLRAIERKKHSFDGEFIVETDAKTIKSDGLTEGWEEQKPPIRVFNRAYVEENIFSTDGDAITPIFFLGEENVEKQKLVESKTRLRQEKNEKYLAKIAEKDKKERELETLYVRGAKAVKDVLLSGGNNPYKNYNRGDFKPKIESLIASGNDAAFYYESDEERAALKARFSGSNKESLIVPTVSLPNLEDIHKAAILILEKSLVIEAIAALQNNETLSAWVKEGLEIHKQEKHQDCQFCLQPLPPERLTALEKHFNDEYSLLETAIADAIDQITAAIEGLGKTASIFPDKAAVFEHLTLAYTENLKALQDSIKKYTDFLEKLCAELLKKKAKPFEKMTVSIVVPKDAAPLAKAYTKVIDQHNEYSLNHETAITDARKKYEESIVAEYFDDYKTLKAEADTAKTDTDVLTRSIASLTHEIKELEAVIKEHHKAADQLNNELQAYLGHDELKFQPQENGYIIHRFDSPAPIKELSEGEKTAIALLYFLKSLEDKNFKPKGIVVIDDPVCSMDDGALFHAFGYIQSKTKDAKQLFILTHNFMFFRQVKNWFNHAPKIGKTVHLYQTTCSIKSDKRCSSIGAVDKMLREHESEYHYLFKLVLKTSLSTGTTELGDFYFMPNVGRRVLEAFLAFRKPSIRGENRLYKMLKAIDYDEPKKNKILRFLNVHSHEDSIGTAEHDASNLAETPQVMADLLALIKKEDSGHFEEMMKVVGG